MRQIRYHVRALSLASAVLGLVVAAGCSTSPRTDSGRVSLEQQARATLTRMQGQDPSLAPVLASSAGYAVFPEVGKGGLIVGGSYGKGILYEGGRMTGFADMTQGTVGAQIGGQSFSQVVVFRTSDALNKFKSGNFTFTGNATAVAIKAGAAASTDFKDGSAVFVQSDAGLMAEAAVGGQRFTYQPADAVPASYR